MSYLTSWPVSQFSSKIALMAAGWQSCSCPGLNGKTQLEFESVALKWNCLLQAELCHGCGVGSCGGRACGEGRLWGLSSLGQGLPICCCSGKGAPLLFSTHVQGPAASCRLLPSKHLHA